MAADLSVTPERMQCMEIWGGNQELHQHFVADGMDIYVDSHPFLGSESGGGDIYYLTSCASGRICRLLLADVSGHGQDAAELATTLRNLMRENVNKISQEKFVKKVNLEFGGLAEDQGFATAVIATFFEPTRTFSVSIAGHPYPMYFHRSRNRWALIDSALMDGKLENLPLGIHDATDYPNFKMHTEVGDMFLLYTDAFVEAVDESGGQIGVQGLLDLLNQKPDLKPNEVIAYLRTELANMSSENLEEDDATAIVGCFQPSKANWVNNLIAPFRLFRSVKDKTVVR